MTSAVLLYQKDESVRDVVVEVLTDEGYPVIVCNSLAAVQAAAARNPMALALVDAWGSSYGVLAERERQNIRDWAAHVPTVMLTARFWAQGVTADELGLLALLSKPIDLEHLIETVDQQVARLHTQSQQRVAIGSPAGLVNIE